MTNDNKYAEVSNPPDVCTDCGSDRLSGCE